MLGRRVLYLVSLIGCFGFYIAYREWMAGLFLLAMLLLPWFCLLISLPAMLSVRLVASPDQMLKIGEQMSLFLKMRSVLPAPALTWRFQVTSSFSREKKIYKRENVFQAEHCGCYRVRVSRGRKYDYLGLFRLPFGRKLCQKIYVLPQKIPIGSLEKLQRALDVTWVPKPQTFSENHELRLYRPGDSLRQIHWKLSSKTGKFIIREPMAPQCKNLSIGMVLSGTADALDCKVGRLLFLTDYFLSQKLVFDLHCLCGDGLHSFRIETERDAHNAVCGLLESPPAEYSGRLPTDCTCNYCIGGETDEVG